MLQNENRLPIEAILKPKSTDETSVPDAKFIRNKAIELEIHSEKNNENDKVDLIIAATKEVKATEDKIDRYSPVFNSEYDLFNKAKKSGPKFNKWGTSRQDTSAFYSAANFEMFPLLMLRSILQAPHPMMLPPNHFSPLQNLGHFEDNLQNEIMSFNQGTGPGNNLPMQVVVSQPIYTASLSGNVQQQHTNSNPFLMHHGLHQNNQISHQNNQIPYQNNNQHSVHRPIFNGGTSQNGYSLNNQNFPQNNNLPSSHPTPFQQQPLISPSLNDKNRISQAIQNILDSNKQPLSLHNRPAYTFERNQQNLNLPPLQGNNIYQQNTLNQQRDHLQPNIKSTNHGSPNYQQNREADVAPYTPVQPHQNSFHKLGQSTGHQQQPFRDLHTTNVNTDFNNQQPLHLQQNNQHTNHHQVGTGNYRPVHGGYNNPDLQSVNHHNTHQLQSLRHQREDEKKIPIYHHSPEGARPSYYRESPRASYEPRHAGNGGIDQSQREQPTREHRQVYREPSYRSEPKDAAFGLTESNNQSGEVIERTPENAKYTEDYDSKPVKKRKSRKKKKIQINEKLEDLEGHSSHQYIIKIG